jgi:hypothetical protein
VGERHKSIHPPLVGYDSHRDGLACHDWNRDPREEDGRAATPELFRPIR